MARSPRLRRASPPVGSKFLPCNNPFFPLPTAVEPRLRLHIEDVRVQFEKDLKEGGGYVTLPKALALKYANADRSTEEDRFVLMGFSASLRILVVCHCYRRSEETIRIISARKATKSERAVTSERWRIREKNMIFPRQNGIHTRSTLKNRSRSDWMKRPLTI